MITPQEFVFLQLKKLLRMQYILSLAESAAASHKLKSDIRSQITELDLMESHYQALSVQRGWEFPEMEPLTRLLASFSFRCREDTSIAEYLINLYNRDSIALLKQYNRWGRDDIAVRNLFQKFIDQYTLGIRQMQKFL